MTSAVAAMHFDPSFNMANRSTFAWPVLENSEPSPSFLGHNLALGPTSDPSLSPPMTTRSTYSPFPELSPAILNGQWPQPSETRPLVRVEPAPYYSPLTRPSTVPAQAEARMTSAVAAMHFDPSFNMANRSTFAWPVLENSEPSPSFLGHNLALGPTSDPSLSPPMTSRSVTSSPPRGSMTPEQRELKRQRDLARRDSKTSARARRAGSSSYMSSPPLSMPDVSTAMGMPIYTTAPAPISLLAEPTTTMPNSSYLSSYSPPLTDQTYSSSYQSISSNYGLGVDYTASFQPAPHYASRPPSMSLGTPPDPSLMYGLPSTMAAGGAASDHSHVRVVQSRPKPQCWEHGCNGRQFSTFSNLLRHQREKSGQASKASCPNCGAEFTRTTARNGHLLHDKCKQRRNT
ncbi:hypothetical protein BN1708_000397 [Verticillium longisporum]|uniref:C2H2-type domain-containing protein n=1 Tax=Verticillium longisporum TaxID=100787 RepID=A0A0G4LCF9_VERLO|nr:hypothetical protein BN1708_000397 [Verticillium longisporum]